MAGLLKSRLKSKGPTPVPPVVGRNSRSELVVPVKEDFREDDIGVGDEPAREEWGNMRKLDIV